MNKPFSKNKNQQINNRILECAYARFIDEGIHNVKMTDIAYSSHIGVATLYRRFSSKRVIVVQATKYIHEKAIMLTKKEVENVDFDKLTGYEEFKVVFNAFIKVVTGSERFFRFMSDLNSYAVSENFTVEEIGQIDDSALPLENEIRRIVTKGLKDKSIRNDLIFIEFFGILKYSFLGLGENMILNKPLIYPKIGKSLYLAFEVVEDMLFEYLKPEKMKKIKTS